MSTKAALKNKKRHAAKKAAVTGGSTGAGAPPARSRTQIAEQTLDVVNAKLAEAKRRKDHAAAVTLREQLWVLTDMLNGVRTALPDQQLQEIMDSIAEITPGGLGDDDGAMVTDPSPAPPPAIRADDRRLLNLRKKYATIVALERKVDEGLKPEKNQLVKLATKTQVAEDIKELEVLQYNLTTNGK